MQYLNGVWTRDLVITCAMLYQLSYEATVKEMSVNDIWNKSYMNCRKEMKMKKWSSQWSFTAAIFSSFSFHFILSS